jgi:hypothetical protein
MFVKLLEAFLELFLDTSVSAFVTFAMTSIVLANCPFRTLFSVETVIVLLKIVLLSHND